MATWNYRVVKKIIKNTHPSLNEEVERVVYGIHEAFYDQNGRVRAVTQDPINLLWEDIDTLRKSWVMMAQAFGLPILDFDKIPEDGAIGFREDPENEDDDEDQMDEVDHGHEFFEEDDFDLRAFLNEEAEERRKAEMKHGEKFVGTPTLEKLFSKLVEEYLKDGE
jgi:hypothetical protein